MGQDSTESKRAPLNRRVLLRALVPVFIGAAFVAFGVIAAVMRGFAAREAGTEATARWLFAAGTGTAVAGAIVIIIIIFLVSRSRTQRRRFKVLKAAFPEGIAFTVMHCMVTVDGRSTAAWRAIRPSEINAIVVDKGGIVILRVRDTVEEIARASGPEVTLALSGRQMYRTEWPEIKISMQSTEGEAKLRVLPTHSRRQAVPSFESVAEMFSAIRAQLNAEQPF